MSQTNEYFKDISKYPTEINNGNIISRMINGLGYRYYWATEKLNENDLIYRPSKDAYSTKETMVHIFTLSKTVYNTTLSKINERPDIDIPVDYKSIRNETLQFLEKASKNFLNLNSKELDQMKIKFNRGGTIKSFPIWNLLNGPIADAIYHTGQIVSFRRTTGNPIDSSVNVFMGSYRQK